MSDIEPKLNWRFPYEVVAPPGGKIHIGNGKFVDAAGNSLDAEDYIPKLEAAAKEIELKLAAAKAEVAKAKGEPIVVEPIVEPPIVVVEPVVEPVKQGK
jgi:hypothetical protein